MLQAWHYRLVAKVSDLYQAIVYLESSKRTQASFTLTAMLIEHVQASTIFIIQMQDMLHMLQFGFLP